MKDLSHTAIADDTQDLVRELLGAKAISYASCLHVIDSSRIAERLRTFVDEVIRKGSLDEILPYPNLVVDGMTYNFEAAQIVRDSLPVELRNEMAEEANRRQISERAYGFLIGVYATERARNYRQTILFENGRVTRRHK